MTAVGSPHLGELEPESVYESAIGFVTRGVADDVPQELPEGESVRKAVADAVCRELKQVTGVDIGDRSISEVLDNLGYLVYPNFHPWGGASGNCLLFRFRPDGDDPHSSIMEFRIMLPAPEGRPRPPAAQTVVLGPDDQWSDVTELGVFAQILEQDEANMVSCQRGLRAAVRTGLNFSRYHESRIRHFHRWLDSYLEDV